MKNGTKEYFVLFIILAISLLIRLPQIDHPFTTEEAEWYFGAKTLSKEFTLINVNQDSPIFNYPIPMTSYRILGLVFGASTIVLRTSALLFALANLILTYFLAKKIFGKKTAIIATGLMGIMPWHIFESVMVEHDGSFLMFFYLITFLSYLHFEETKKNKWFVVSITAFVLALFTKSSAILIPAILMTYIFFKGIITLQRGENKNPRKIVKPLLLAVKQGIIMLAAGFIPLLIFLKFIKTYSPIYHEALVGRVGEAIGFTQGFGLLSVIRVIMYLVLWASPLLLGLTLLSLKDWKKEKLLFACWIIIPVLAYSVSPQAGGIDRYLSVIIPAMAILSGALLSNITMNKARKKILIYGTIIAYAILVLLNGMKSNYIVHDIGSYLKKAVTAQWNFLFPFYGSSGPAFLVTFIMLGTGIVLSAIFLLLTVLNKNKDMFLTLFLITSVALNIVIIGEFIFNVQQPDIYEINKEVAESYVQTPDEGVLYLSTSGLSILLQRFDENVSIISGSYARNNFDMLQKNLNEKGGIVLFVDFPKTIETSPQKKLLENCEVQKTLSDKEIDIGFIYRCSALTS